MVVNGSKMYISIYNTIGAILSLSTGFIGFLRLFYVGCLFTIGFGGGRSHVFTTKISDNNKVEFIFENIQLPFATGSNQGFVAFKIKTLPSLVVGDTFSNSANIYFDYNFPILTNSAVTTVSQPLSNQDFQLSNIVSIYPNPAKNNLYLRFNDKIEISSFNVS